MNVEHIIEVGSWIAGIGSFIAVVYFYDKKKKTSIKQENEEGANLLNVKSDKELETVKQKNKKGDNKVSL